MNKILCTLILFGYYYVVFYLNIFAHKQLSSVWHSGFNCQTGKSNGQYNINAENKNIFSKTSVNSIDDEDEERNVYPELFYNFEVKPDSFESVSKQM